jgi:hypothetical protein
MSVTPRHKRQEHPPYTSADVQYLAALNYIQTPVWVYDATRWRQAFANKYVGTCIRGVLLWASQEFLSTSLVVSEQVILTLCWTGRHCSCGIVLAWKSSKRKTFVTTVTQQSASSSRCCQGMLCLQLFHMMPLRPASYVMFTFLLKDGRELWTEGPQ